MLFNWQGTGEIEKESIKAERWGRNVLKGSWSSATDFHLSTPPAVGPNGRRFTVNTQAHILFPPSKFGHAHAYCLSVYL